MSLALECLYKTQVKGGNLNITEMSTIMRHMLNGVKRFIEEATDQGHSLFDILSETLRPEGQKHTISAFLFHATANPVKLRKFETFVFNTNSILEACNELKLLKGNVASKLNQIRISQNNKEELPLNLNETLNCILQSTGQINALIKTIKERAAITIP